MISRQSTTTTHEESGEQQLNQIMYQNLPSSSLSLDVSVISHGKQCHSTKAPILARGPENGLSNVDDDVVEAAPGAVGGVKNPA